MTDLAAMPERGRVIFREIDCADSSKRSGARIGGSDVGRHGSDNDSELCPRQTDVAGRRQERTLGVAIDPTSIKPHGEYVEAWTRTLFNELQKDASNPLKPVTYKWTKYLYDFDCKGQRVLLRHFTRYTGPLEVQDIKVPSGGTKWQAADNPNSVGSLLLNVVCKKP